MGVSLETLNGLERKLTITVPAEQISEEVNVRVRDLVRKVKIDGYRPGKAPLDIVKRRFQHAVQDEVARELAQNALADALRSQDVKIAGYPNVEPLKIEAGKDLIFSAKFEIYPKITINTLDNAPIEQIESAVIDVDVDTLIQKMLEQDKIWHSVDRSVAEGDKIKLDFIGYVDGVAFEGGKAHNFELIIGSGSMIPGFETGIIGAAINEPRDIQVKFPEEYHAKELAGKDAVFKITVTEILEGKTAELDDTYAAKYVKEGGVEAFKKEIRENMEKQLENQIITLNKEKIFDKMMTINEFDLPTALVDHEIENLKHEFFHKIYGNHHSEHEKIPDFPRQMFEDRAKRRVHLGLLFSEFVAQNQIQVDESRVESFIERLSASYENPEEMRQYYLNNEDRMNEIRSVVLEEIVVEKIAQTGQIVKLNMSYDAVMNPKLDNTSKG